MHRVLKIALQAWPTLALTKSLIEFGLKDKVGETYHWTENCYVTSPYFSELIMSDVMYCLHR